MSRGVSSQRFSASQSAEELSIVFGITGEELYWDNPGFDNGAARFCANATSSVLYGYFRGSLPKDCRLVNLRALASMLADSFCIMLCQSMIKMLQLRRF